MYTEFVPDLKPLAGLQGRSKSYDRTWDFLALAEAVAASLPRDLNFKGNVRDKPKAKYCVVSFPGLYSGDFALLITQEDPNLCSACVFQADGTTTQFLGPPMTSPAGEHAGHHWQDFYPMTKGKLPQGKSCPDSCWCTELEGASTVNSKGQKVSVVVNIVGNKIRTKARVVRVVLESSWDFLGLGILENSHPRFSSPIVEATNKNFGDYFHTKNSDSYSHIQRTFGKDKNGNDFMTPPWGCYWYGQWLGNIEYAAKQGMEFIVVYKPDGQGRGELDCFPTKEDWEGADGKSYAKDAFLGGSQVFCRLDHLHYHAKAQLQSLPKHLIQAHLLILALADQKKELAYIEKVLGLEIHHKLDIHQFRNKEYERPKVRES